MKVKDWWIPRMGGWGLHRRSTGGSHGCESVLCDTAMVNSHLYTFVKTPRRHNTKREPSCKQWASVNDVDDVGSSVVTY